LFRSFAVCRTILDLIFLDRLRALKDKDLKRLLKFVEETETDRASAIVDGAGASRDPRDRSRPRDRGG